LDRILSSRGKFNCDIMQTCLHAATAQKYCS
jgi:hypothetical protein